MWTRLFVDYYCRFVDYCSHLPWRCLVTSMSHSRPMTTTPIRLRRSPLPVVLAHILNRLDDLVTLLLMYLLVYKSKVLLPFEELVNR